MTLQVRLQQDLSLFLRFFFLNGILVGFINRAYMGECTNHQTIFSVGLNDGHGIVGV